MKNSRVFDNCKLGVPSGLTLALTFLLDSRNEMEKKKKKTCVEKDLYFFMLKTSTQIWVS